MGTAVAIVGMAGRVPGSDSVDAFWLNLCAGVDSTTTPLAALDEFDANFFGYTGREAEVMDPQHRLFLETAWEALEHAGYDVDRCGKNVGVFGGGSTTAYLNNILSNLDAGASVRESNVGLGNELSFLTTRVSHKLDLHGPSFPVQASCSSSLVAVHLACQSLLNYECDMALAGGVSFTVPPESDGAVGGTAVNNGVGVVLLKRLPDAIGDRDTIYAVIAGSAVNHNGDSTPSVEQRAAVIIEAQAQAEIAADAVSYLELHGIPAADGDADELRALKRVFGHNAAPVALGSVTSNVGNLDAAAGVAGLLKTALALHHRTIPAAPIAPASSLTAALDGGPLRLPRASAEWRAVGGSRSAGINSFGAGGTNAHVVLTEAPAAGPSEDGRPSQVLPLSAPSSEALEQLTDRLGAALRRNRPSLADAAFTLALGRRQFAHRRALVVADLDSAVSALETRDSSSLYEAVVDSTPPHVAFVFPDGELPGDAASHYGAEPAFQAAMRQCAELRPGDSQRPELVRFAMQLALAHLWLSWGVSPDAVSGSGLGELVAAFLAEELSLPDALELAALSSRAPAEQLASVKAAVPRSPRTLRAAQPGDARVAMVPSQSLADLQSTLARLWVTGVPIDWSGYFAGEKRRRIALPTYSFQRSRYWLERRAAAQPRRGEPAEFETVRTDDHAVFVTRLEPGRVFRHEPSLEIARAVGDSYFGEPVTLADRAEVLAPLIPPHDGGVRTVHVTVRPSGPDVADFRVVSHDGADWTVHASGTLAIPRDAAELELTHAQRGFWIMHRLHGAGMELHLPVWQVVAQHVDVSILERAVNYLVARHDALRTVIRVTPAGPHQFALERHLVAIPAVDVSELPDPHAEARALIAQDNERTFDMSEPFIRGALYRLGRDEFCIYLNLHHMIADGLSAGLLLRELQVVYEALASDSPPSLPPLSETFLGHVRAEQQWLLGDEAQRMRDYWLAELPLPLPQLSLADRDEGPAGRTDFREFGIGGDTTDRLQACARELRITMNTVLLSAYFVALHRVAGAADLIVGLPFGGRRTKDFEGVVGLFVNTLSIRAEVRPDTVFANLAQRVGEKSLAAYRNSRYPFGLLVEQLNPRRESRRNPVFSTAFQYADFLPPTYQVGGLDAGLYGQPGPGGIEMRISYSTARLSASRVQTLVTTFLQVIEGVAADRRLVVGSLDRSRSAKPATRSDLQARISARRNT